MYVSEANNTENAHFFHSFKFKLFDTVSRVNDCTFVYKKNLLEIGNKAKAERPRKTLLVSVYSSVCVAWGDFEGGSATVYVSEYVYSYLYTALKVSLQ